MSSNGYSSKSRQEIEPIIENYLTNFTRKFGESPDLSAIITRMEQLKEEREQELLLSMFGHLGPKNLGDAIEILKQRQDDNASQLETKESKGFFGFKAKE